MSRNSYESALSGRYASQEMKYQWSQNRKFSTWRLLWVELARAQQTLGLPITNGQIAEMEANVANIDYDSAARHERSLRHDVMAHIHAFGEVAPTARPIIHLGATSCDITDNTELIQIRDSLRLLRTRLATAISRIRDFAEKYRDLPILGFTHLQPAQPITVGKRAAMWLVPLLMDLEALEELEQKLKFRGVKGATGTQNSFLKLFQGDHAKVKELDRLVTEKFGFAQSFLITGQTYTRKLDSTVISALAGLGESAHKIGVDMRLLQSRKEVEEPFGEDQVGSSAMAYKRNPMRCERMCALARELMSQILTAQQTHAQQWFERTLDDSAARRFYLPRSFLLADAIISLLQSVFEGIVVYPAVIRRNLMEELPFMATEEIIMAMVTAGADRQECHKWIRDHSQAAATRVKQEGLPNNLLELLHANPYFAAVHNLLPQLVDPTQFIGRAPEQVDEFLPVCDAALAPYRDELEARIDIPV